MTEKTLIWVKNTKKIPFLIEHECEEGDHRPDVKNLIGYTTSSGSGRRYWTYPADTGMCPTNAVVVDSIELNAPSRSYTEYMREILEKEKGKEGMKETSIVWVQNPLQFPYLREYRELPVNKVPTNPDIVGYSTVKEGYRRVWTWRTGYDGEGDYEFEWCPVEAVQPRSIALNEPSVSYKDTIKEIQRMRGKYDTRADQPEDIEASAKP